MFIAMNNFKICRGCEETFLEHWRNRTSFLAEMPGFQRFNLLRGSEYADYTLFTSHSEWASRQAFEEWTRSDAFKRAHVNAGKVPKDIYFSPPKLELYEVVL